MREGWTYKKFEDCLVKAPKAKQVQTSEYNTGSKYPIISQEDKMVSGYCDDSSLLYHIDNPVVVFGDHTRVLKYVDFDFVVGADGVKILIPKEFLKAKFLLYYLRWYKVPSLGYSRHYKLLKEITLPVPPIAEQERIVAELDLLSDIIEKKKGQLKAYDQLAQSIFFDMFGDPIDNPKGWEVKKLKEVVSVRGRVGWKGYKKEDLRESGPLAIGGGHIMENGSLDFSSPVFLSIEKYEESPEIMVQRGDLIMVQRGTIGRIGLVKNEIGDATINPCVLILRPNSINELYVLHLILNEDMQYYLSTLVRGVAQPMITQKQVNSLDVPLPPLSLQQEFAEKIEAIERQKALIQQSIAEIQTMFDCTMDKYFE